MYEETTGVATQRDIIPNYYPTEVERYQVGCLREDGVTLDYAYTDKRYQVLTDVFVTEYEVQFASGVIQTIFAQPKAEEYVSENVKKKSKYFYYMRPTHNFSLQCMKDGKDIQDFLPLLASLETSSAAEVDAGSTKYTIALCIVPAILAFLIMKFDKTIKCMRMTTMVFTLVLVIVEVALIIPIIMSLLKTY